MKSVNPMSAKGPMALLSFLFLTPVVFGGRTDATEIAAPTCSSKPILKNNNNIDFVDTFLDAYGETVDAIVKTQTQTWNYIPRYKTFDRAKTDDESCESLRELKGYTNTPKFQRDKDHKASSDLTEMKYDSETDIPDYLQEIIAECSKDIEENIESIQDYERHCLDLMKSIIYDPRCTTRYDSRAICNGEPITTMASPQRLIQQHFREDSLNVVIVGTGPVGLMLANSLSVLHQRGGGTKDIPPIRILMLDTRAEAFGMKKAYTRNWQAQLSLLHFRESMDPRLADVFRSLHNARRAPRSKASAGFVATLNLLETMLYLSTRDLGATKFLFGVNPLDLVNNLLDVPNLVLVDATGHRIEPLQRGRNHCDEKDIVQTIEHFRAPAQPTFPWADENPDFYEHLETFAIDFSEDYDFMEAHGHSTYIGKQENLIYPVDEATGIPKSMYWLDIHGAAPYTRAERRTENTEKASRSLYANDGDFCSFCEEHYAMIQAMKEKEEIPPPRDRYTTVMCDDMCYTDYISQSAYLLRSDLVRQLQEGHHTNTFVARNSTKDAWFPLNGYQFNLSEELAQEAAKILTNHGFYGHPVGMPLRKMVPELEEFVKKSNASEESVKIVEAVKRFALRHTHSDADWPVVTLDEQTPFIYTNGVKPKRKLGEGERSTCIGDYLEHAPMIRIGDSFTTGDGLNGAGMYTHATMVGVFMDAILFKTRETRPSVLEE